jgi:hypothetical protein
LDFAGRGDANLAAAEMSKAAVSKQVLLMNYA